MVLLMHQVLTGSIGNLLGCMRNRYDQNIFNFQLQDSITLDKSGSLVLTPAIRYNQSEIIGYSDGSRFTEDSKTHFHWIHPKDSQTNGKWTWQLALKKRFNDHFTLRTTGGTYYRLLNMYEIAGDGAGILPAPRDDSVSVSRFRKKASSSTSVSSSMARFWAPIIILPLPISEKFRQHAPAFPGRS